MYDIFQTYMGQYLGAPLTDEAFTPFKAAFIPKKIRRKQYLLQEGDVCRHLSFIARGAMRQYTVDEKGVEHIVRFGIENWWMADRESFEMQTPTRYNIDAWEDSDVLQVTHARLDELKVESPLMKELTMSLDRRGSIAAQQRIHAAISLTAEERYLDLLKTRPEFLQRFPQNMIASYLGVSPESLSRIRRQIFLK